MINTTQHRHLFRENALKRQNEAEIIQGALKIVHLRGWLWLGICMLALTGILIWGIFGKLEISVLSNGILLPIKFIEQSEKMIEDNINIKQKKLNTLKTLLAKKRKLYQQHYLTAIDLERAEEEYANAKQDSLDTLKYLNPNSDRQVFSLNKPTDIKNMQALMFVKAAEGKKILPGMRVYLLPTMLMSFQHGYLKGRVIGISHYPVTRELAYSYLGNMNLVDEYFSGSAPFIVKIRLDRDNKNISGYAWTTNKGPPFVIESGSTVTAKIITQRSSPYKFILHYE